MDLSQSSINDNSQPQTELTDLTGEEPQTTEKKICGRRRTPTTWNNEQQETAPSPRKKKNAPTTYLDKEVEIVKIGVASKKLTNKRYDLGNRWIIQVGEIEFEPGKGAEVLFFIRTKTDQTDEFHFNIPIRLIAPLREGLGQLLRDSGVDPDKL